MVVLFCSRTSSRLKRYIVFALAVMTHLLFLIITWLSQRVSYILICHKAVFINSNDESHHSDDDEDNDIHVCQVFSHCCDTVYSLDSTQRSRKSAKLIPLSSMCCCFFGASSLVIHLRSDRTFHFTPINPFFQSLTHSVPPLLQSHRHIAFIFKLNCCRQFLNTGYGSQR